MAFYSSLFSVCPRIRKQHGRLIATTSLWFQILTLGLLHKRVTIDPKEEVVRIRRRYLWLIRRNTKIPFRSIAAITYGYQDWGDTWNFSLAHDSKDFYTVGLRLHSGQERRLFYFVGDGEFQNDGPLPDWWYWQEYMFDFAGTQQRESRMYVEALSKMIGAEVRPPALS
jgi:hypothetical protein